MLVLTRSPGEEITIGNDIVVRIVRTRGDRVTVGIKAPLNVPVHRREVLEKMLRGSGTEKSE
jgi:carbon storage regulator